MQLNDPNLGPLLSELEKSVCELAYRYQVARTSADVAVVVAEYQEALRQLVRAGYREYLTYDCELPGEFLPIEYLQLVEDMNRGKAARQNTD